MSKHTPRPWEIGEFDEILGYDCMTCGIRSGPVVLDGSNYGQERCEPIEDAAKEMMIADAKLIAAAPDLLEALELLAYPSMGTIKGNGETHIGWQPGDGLTANERLAKARAAIRKATE